MFNAPYKNELIIIIIIIIMMQPVWFGLGTFVF